MNVLTSVFSFVAASVITRSQIINAIPMGVSGVAMRSTSYRPALNCVNAHPALCRVANKVGKACAIKVGMDSEDRDMEQDDGFGVFVWGMAEVVDVSIGA